MKTDGKGGPKLILPPVMVRTSMGAFTAPSVLRLSDGTQIAIPSAERMDIHYELLNGNLSQIMLRFSSASGQADTEDKKDMYGPEDDLCS